MLSGYALVITLIALGVGSLVVQFPAALDVLTVFGAGYLLWLGATTLRSVRAASTSSATTAASAVRTETGTVSAPATHAGAFVRGFAISSLNPKGMLLLVALLPQFVDGVAPDHRALLL